MEYPIKTHLLIQIRKNYEKDLFDRNSGNVSRIM